MLRGRAKYIPLLIFLFGLLLIVFLQFNSSQSIGKLIDGNTDLLNELETRNELQKLETELIGIESGIRGGIITQDRSDLDGIKNDISNVQQRIKQIQENIKDSGTNRLFENLDRLVNRKILFNQRVLDTFNSNGKYAAEKIINTYGGKQLTDSIFDAVDDVDSSRQVVLSEIIRLVDDNGRAARNRGFILAIVACAFCIVAFWYIVNQSMQQQQLINVLDASEKKVKEAAHIKEQFLANMSHEIRTPMNAILGFANLLQKTDMNAVQKQYAENIQSSGEKLLTIVNDILDLSKIEAGMMRIEPAPFSLRALVHSIETMFSQKASEKELSLVFFIEEEIPDILEGDAVRLTQVLINLLGNALKFTDKGGIKLIVNLAERTNDIVKLRFNVKDTGIGITADKQQKIFERFQQAESDTTRRYGGTGLGLSIARQIIDLQNGTIKVESRVGEGTTFVFELSYIISGKKSESPGQQLMRNSMAYLTSGIKILIAEDNNMNQQLMKHLMDSWKINYKIVGNGNEALKELETNSFNLVLMDIQMPELDGYHATTMIREKLKSKIPVIAMTAHAMAGEKEKCLSYGMNDYISKPVREAELYDLIKHFTKDISAATDKGHGSSIIDLAYLREISKGDKQFEQEMIDQFLIQVPEEVELLRLSIEQKEYESVRTIAHKLKSSVSFLGLSAKLDPILSRLEAIAGKADNPLLLQQNFDSIKYLCGLAVTEAKSLIAH